MSQHAPQTDQHRSETFTSLCAKNYDLVSHHQGQRATMAGIILTTSAALLAVITFDQKIEDSDTIPAFLVLLLSGYGAFTALKHHERVKFYLARAEALRDQLSSEIRPLFEIADRKTHKCWFWAMMGWVKMWSLWLLLYAFLGAISGHIIWSINHP